jgi:hypothetical protein
MMRRSYILRNAAPPAAAAAKMVKSYKLFEVSSQCSPHDSMFARKLPGGGCQFFAWPGLSQSLACQGILSMPSHLQTVHSLFGRNDVPMDICADIDCAVPEELRDVEAVQSFQKKIVMQHIQALHEAIHAEGETIESQVCLQSPNFKKASFHLHIKLKDAAFADFRSLHGFMQTAAAKGNMPNVDLQIYRHNGMLRMYKSKKESLQSPISLYADPSTHIGFPNGVVSDLDAAIHSLGARGKDTFSRLIYKQSAKGDYNASTGMNAGATSASGSADGATAKISCSAPKSKLEACENAKAWILSIPAEHVQNWRGWLGVGMSAYRIAHHFNDVKVATFQGQTVEHELLHAWIELSKKVPHKFVPGDCEKSWATFTPETREDSWWVSYRALFNAAHGTAARR